MPTPILLISDAPDTTTGLGRIARDLATVLSTMPEFRVATFGRGGTGSRDLPWMQYTFDEVRQWGEELLVKVYNDFSQGFPIVIFTIWDASRLFWFGHPQALPEGVLRELLTSTGRFQRWGYFPIDAYGPNQKLSVLSGHALSGYNRVLAYSRFGRDTLSRTLMDWQPDYIPHGIHPDTYYNRGRDQGRGFLGIDKDAKLVGCVMANQARKDWGTWAQMARILVDKDPSYHFWAHVDILEHYWSLPALVEDFGLGDHVKITQNVTDDTLSQLYSACDITVLPSLGEGFGYPIAESLACGVPVIHHMYAAGGELIETENLVVPSAFRLDTLHNLFRPVLDPVGFAYKVNEAVTNPSNKEELRASVEHLFWPNLAPLWKNWFKKGLDGA